MRPPYSAFVSSYSAGADRASVENKSAHGSELAVFTINCHVHGRKTVSYDAYHTLLILTLDAFCWESGLRAVWGSDDTEESNGTKAFENAPSDSDPGEYDLLLKED
jgi:hypothetical protein